MKIGHWLLTVAVAWWSQQGSAAVRGECTPKCGGVTVPFPFGLEPNCARSTDFWLNCTKTKGSVFRLMLGNLPILNISVGDSTMVVSVPEVYECFDQNHSLANRTVSINLPPNPRYRFSATQNKLIVVGCNVLADVADGGGTVRRGCASYCSSNVDFAKETTCSGEGCCQTSIPGGGGLTTLNITLSSIGQNESNSEGGHCARAFMVDNRPFNISNLTLPTFQDVGNNRSTSLVLDWMVESDVICAQAKKNWSSYACGKNTNCTGFGNGSGYRCVCNPGYNGNPYNRFGGCKAIPCPFGQKLNKGRCQISPSAIAFAAMAVSVGITITASVPSTIRWRLRNMNFRKNGGELMENRKVPIFTESKLAKATNRKELRNDGFGFVYKGTLEEHNGTVVVRDTVVVVKKPKDVDRSLLNKDFQHELEILMNISCKNVVKLKGICLETKIPLLVYEYIPNGTLFQLIHQNESTISWEKRFKIATQAALALNYMHSKLQSPIFHGNIKSTNILLDQNNSVKISDFGTSVLISPKHRHMVATQKKDSLAYIDPEYLVTGMLTPQSDAYSFGVVLVELLTGKELYVIESEKSFNTIHCFISSVKGDTLSDVINFEGASEDEMEKIRSVAKIAVKCLDHSGANRPAMSHVAQQLASINPSSTVEEENEEPELEVDAEEL